jgi:hypothetical protein
MRRGRYRDEGTGMRIDLTIVARAIRDIVWICSRFGSAVLKSHPDAC